MASIVSRWPVLLHAAVDAADRDGNGALSAVGAERLFCLARDAYFERCPTVDVTQLRARAPSVRPAAARVDDIVTVSAGVVEIFPESFLLAVRIRSADTIAADITCSFTTQGPIPASMRDEFIALAHGAKHVH